MANTDSPKTIHQGRNVKRFREMLGIKQEALADQLGGEWSQKKISLLEGKEVIEAELLDQLAKALKVPAESLKNFSEDAAISYFNNFHDHSTGAFQNYNCTFNAIDKIVELYDALLKSEREKIAMLERFLEGKK